MANLDTFNGEQPSSSPAPTLNTFNTQQAYSIDDFHTQEEKNTPPVSSSGSDRNNSAVTALLNAPTDGNQAVLSYIAMNDEYAQKGYSDAQRSIVDARRQMEMQQTRSVAADVITNPELDDSIKRQVVGTVNNPSLPMYSAEGMMATQEASQPVAGETNESASLRGVWAGAIDEVLTFQRDRQKVYNEMAQQEKAQGSAAGWVDMAEGFVPGAMGYKQARMFSGLSDKTTGTIASFFLPGSSKASIVDKFNGLPIAERQQFMDEISKNLSEDGKTILLPHAKDRANLEAFRQITESGSYTVTDETIDNLFGLLDVTGLGSALRTAGKALGVGGKAVEAAGEATARNSAARRPTNDSEWRTGAASERGVYDENGNPNYGVRDGDMTPTQRSWQRRFIGNDVQPASPMDTIKDANPEKARQLHNAIEQDSTDEIASAMTGTTREQAIASNIAPQPSSVDGTVQSKTHRPEQYTDLDNMPDAAVMDFAHSTSAPNISTKEKRALDANVMNDFQNATGLVNRKEMTSIGEADGGLNISAVYGPTDSGWATLDDAKNQAAYALRKYGITEDDMSVLVRKGDSYVTIPFSSAKQEANVSGDFLLQINQKYQYNAGDLAAEQFEKFGVSTFLNAFNRTGFLAGKHGGGGLINQAIDPGALFHPEFMKGSVLADLKKDGLSEKMLASAQPFVDSVKGMKVERRAAMENKIREANKNGTEYNYTQLKAEGFAENEIEAMTHFKKVQDTLWHLTNEDMAKSYRTRGFGRMTYDETGFDVIARDMKEGSVPANVTVYDALKDETRMMSKGEVKELYSRNGSIAEMAHPIEIEGRTILHTINENSAAGTYLRAIKDSDPVMAYRKGYYAVRYKNPHFIEKKLQDADGKELLDEHGQVMWKAVATAPDIKSAESAMARYTAMDGAEYRRRGDLKGEAFEKANTQAHTAGGLSAQRVRGKRLEDATGSNMELDGSHLESPVESMLRSIESVSSRVSYRDWIETSKQRILATYSDVLPKRNGVPAYPRNVSEIVGTSKTAADARATYEYVRAMENGYVNMIDDGYKAGMNLLADSLGVRGFDKTERFLREAGSHSAVAAPKRVVFDLMIALSPMRQWLVQGGQALFVLARFPAYSTRIVSDSVLLLLHHMSGNMPKAVYEGFGRSKEEFLAMMKAMDESGITKGIKRHELVQGIVNTSVDASIASTKAASAVRTVASIPGKITSFARKIGFDAGEWYVQSASYMAHYDAAMKTGTKLDKAGLDTIASNARQYTGNFSRSGALASNQNTLSMFTQFLQVPLKMLALFGNKSIPAKARAQIAIISVLGGGITTEQVYRIFEKELPKDEFQRQLIANGLVTSFANASIKAVFGSDSKIDWGGSLNPFDPQGLFTLMENVYSSGMDKTLQGLPAGSLIAGSNPRITNLIKSFGMASGLGDRAEGVSSPEAWLNVVKDVGNLSSGWSNVSKALALLEYGKMYSQTGQVTRNNVSTPEAIAKAFGLQSLDDVAKFAVTKDIADAHKDFSADVKETFTQHARLLAGEGNKADQTNYVIRMSQFAMSLYPTNYAARQQWWDMLHEQVKGGDDRTIKALKGAVGWADTEDVLKWIDQAPGLSDEQRKGLREFATLSFSPQQSSPKQSK